MYIKESLATHSKEYKFGIIGIYALKNDRHNIKDLRLSIEHGILKPCLYIASVIMNVAITRW